MLKIWGRDTSSNVQKVRVDLRRARHPVRAGRLGRSLRRQQGPALPRAQSQRARAHGRGRRSRHLGIEHHHPLSLRERTAASASIPRTPAARTHVERWMDWQLSAHGAADGGAASGLFPHAARRSAIPPRSRRRASTRSTIGASSRTGSARGPYLAGNDFTLADIPVAIFARRWYRLSDRAAEACRGSRPGSSASDQAGLSSSTSAVPMS